MKIFKREWFYLDDQDHDTWDNFYLLVKTISQYATTTELQESAKLLLDDIQGFADFLTDEDPED